MRWAPLAGPLGALAAGAFLLATQCGYLSVAGVLASLYPATTVLLAALLLRERIHRAQGVGLGLCAAAIALVAGPQPRATHAVSSRRSPSQSRTMSPSACWPPAFTATRTLPGLSRQAREMRIRVTSSV